MVSDYSELVHHGLVVLGGFTRVADLIAEERRGLYAIERPYVSAGSSRDRPIGASVILNDLTTQLNNALAHEHW